MWQSKITCTHARTSFQKSLGTEEKGVSRLKAGRQKGGSRKEQYKGKRQCSCTAKGEVGERAGFSLGGISHGLLKPEPKHHRSDFG